MKKALLEKIWEKRELLLSDATKHPNASEWCVEINMEDPIDALDYYTENALRCCDGCIEDAVLDACRYFLGIEDVYVTDLGDDPVEAILLICTMQECALEDIKDQILEAFAKRKK